MSGELKWLRLLLALPRECWEAFMTGYRRGRQRRKLVTAIRNYRDAISEKRR